MTSKKAVNNIQTQDTSKQFLDSTDLFARPVEGNSSPIPAHYQDVLEALPESIDFARVESLKKQNF